MNEDTTAERLQKVLAGLGLGSRREIEEWIRAGRVTVNGKTAELGVRAGPADEIAIDGRAVARAAPNPTQETVVLGYHKPVGEVTTRKDPAGRPTVFDRLPAPPSGRWVVVGRLDVNTSGLLLFTTDGELAHRLMHPSSEVEREYLVRVRHQPDAATLERLQQGVQLDDGPARFETVVAAGSAIDTGTGAGTGAGASTDAHSWYRVSLREGRNREVRRLWQAVGHEVSRLKRLRYGPVSLPEDLRLAQARRLPESLIAALRAAVDQAAR